MPTLIIGFSGKARSGKDTAATAIIEARGGQYDIRRYAFADALKRWVAKQDVPRLCLEYGLPYDFNAPMDDPLCPPPYGKQRALLQHIGTEIGRKRDPYIWIKLLKATLDNERPQVALITDVRFPNELLWIKANYGAAVRVHRLGVSNLELSSDHSSETALDHLPAGLSWDVEVRVPDGCLDELKKDAVELFDYVVKGQVPNEETISEYGEPVPGETTRPPEAVTSDTKQT